MEVLMQGIGKAFGPVRVLEGVDFHISAGEIHALMGENGAGKSTLMKILCGVYQADAGKILIDGRAAQIRNTVEAEHAGRALDRVRVAKQRVDVLGRAAQRHRQRLRVASSFFRHLPQAPCCGSRWRAGRV